MKKLFFGILFSLFALEGLAQVAEEKGAVTPLMNAGRIVDSQEVILADLPYFKGKGAPFSIMLVPKQSDNYTEVAFMKLQYYQGEVARITPVLVNTWNNGAYIRIDTDNPTIFELYNVYVGFGQDIPGL